MISGPFFLAVIPATRGSGLLCCGCGLARTPGISRGELDGVRAMLTHPIDEDAARFCTRFGFIASPLAPGHALACIGQHVAAVAGLDPVAPQQQRLGRCGASEAPG